MTHKPKITLATLPQASAQEVFDQVVQHMIGQGEKSMNKGGCLYKYEKDGIVLRCAAGCLIADSEYEEEMENKAWSTLIGNDLVPRKHAELIERLQDVHDFTDPIKWEQALQKLAYEFALDYNSIPQTVC